MCGCVCVFVFGFTLNYISYNFPPPVLLLVLLRRLAVAHQLQHMPEAGHRCIAVRRRRHGPFVAVLVQAVRPVVVVVVADGPGARSAAGVAVTAAAVTTERRPCARIDARQRARRGWQWRRWRLR